MEPVVVFGAGGHAKVVIDAIEQQGAYRVAAVIVDRPPPEVSPEMSPEVSPEALSDAGSQTIAGYPLLGDDWRLSKQAQDVTKGIVAVGGNHTRRILVERIRQASPQFVFIQVVHPDAVVARSVELGAGTVVMAGVVINSGTRIGNYCIINTQASIDHDNVVEDFASLAPGVTTGGNVIIGHQAAIGLGANIIHGRHIGDGAVIGAGSLVLKDIGDSVVAYGVPAKIIRTRTNDDPYL